MRVYGCSCAICGELMLRPAGDDPVCSDCGADVQAAEAQGCLS